MAEINKNFIIPKTVKEFCEIWNEIFNCRTEYGDPDGCDLVCPLYAFIINIQKMKDRNIDLKSAVRAFIKRGMSADRAIKIIEQKFSMSIDEIQKNLKEIK